MGLFREAGRRIERFRKAAEEAAAEDADYRCGACGEFVFTDGEPERCPECGEDALVATDAGDEGGDVAEGGTEENAKN